MNFETIDYASYKLFVWLKFKMSNTTNTTNPSSFNRQSQWTHLLNTRCRPANEQLTYRSIAAESTWQRRILGICPISARPCRVAVTVPLSGRWTGFRYPKNIKTILGILSRLSIVWLFGKQNAFLTLKLIH